MITQDIGERNNLANTATAKRDELIDDLLAWWQAKLQKELDAWMIQQKDKGQETENLANARIGKGKSEEDGDDAEPKAKKKKRK